MNEYKKLSFYFDQIMEFIDYTEWEEFTLKYAKGHYDALDLACGSGLLMLLMTNDGYNFEGLDLSSDMLDNAYDLLMGNHIHPTLYLQDMTNFNTNKKYDLITCYFDSINHLDDINKVKECFKSVYNHLNKGGLFLFDVFSKSRYLAAKDMVVSEDFEDFSYEWKTDIKEPNVLMHDITIKTLDDTIHEYYNEYYYELKDMIDLNLFKIKKICGDFKDDLTSDDDRVLVVLERVN